MSKSISLSCGIRFPSMHLPNYSSSPPVKPRNNHHYTYYQPNHQITKSQQGAVPILVSACPPPLLSMLVSGGGAHSPSAKSYDYTLKFLLVGDSDVGKNEILSGLDEDDNDETKQHFGGSCEVAYKSTIILLDGRRIRLQLWDTSGGQGRFSTIIRSYSRGAQGILLVYDITNKWSFSGLNRWLREVEQHAPGVPKILIGNRLHLAFKRQVNTYTAENYASKNNMAFFEVSPLCNYNIRESFAELSRLSLQRHGMENLWRHNTVLSLQELCCRTIVARTTVYGIEHLPLPISLKYCLKSYSSLKPYQLKNRSIIANHQKLNRTKHLKDINGSLKKKAKSLLSSMFRLGA